MSCQKLSPLSSWLRQPLFWLSFPWWQQTCWGQCVLTESVHSRSDRAEGEMTRLLPSASTHVLSRLTKPGSHFSVSKLQPLMFGGLYFGGGYIQKLSTKNANLLFLMTFQKARLVLNGREGLVSFCSWVSVWCWKRAAGVKRLLLQLTKWHGLHNCQKVLMD